MVVSSNGIIRFVPYLTEDFDGFCAKLNTISKSVPVAFVSLKNKTVMQHGAAPLGTSNQKMYWQGCNIRLNCK
ncbi:MAG: hypothetical protein IKL32_02785 [Alphaproteobacteria bacterium]|nr:hypothetical protein [Alphaproteobacteria bacterium]